jgi:adenylate cyclase
LRLSAQAGDRETANRIAAEIDARPAGPLLLLVPIFFCRCGAPFDLETTPNFAARLAEAGLAWPPASPVDWYLMVHLAGDPYYFDLNREEADAVILSARR